MRLDPGQFRPDQKEDVCAINAEFAAMGEGLGLLMETDDLRLGKFLHDANDRRKKLIMERIGRLASDPILTINAQNEKQTDDPFLIRLANDSEIESVVTAKEELVISNYGDGVDGIVKYVYRCAQEMAKVYSKVYESGPARCDVGIAAIAIHRLLSVVMAEMIDYQVELELCRRGEERESTTGEGK